MPVSVGGPLPTAARQGREHQRYSVEGDRLVAGCIPVRLIPGKEGAEGVEVLLITGRGGKGFVFPKGGWETDESVEIAARRETVEEAGVRGILEEPMLGTFAFSSGKAVHRPGSQGRCVAYMFVMHVAEELASWPEEQNRKRYWCTLQEACNKCRHEWMRDALVAWIRLRGWDHIVPLKLQDEHQPAIDASLQHSESVSAAF